ncbi:MAG TPA: 16S rRNA (guanine(527)-N(7))-methyltransferase RsmG [Burkholderiales bacterium]|nr:16S rRNA (guanine(527)-N(7))-methyltransferase RsmG [Burkholderiales bacterium]
MALDDLLAQGIAELGLSVPAATQHRMRDYLKLIEKWNRTFSLTAIRSPEDMLRRHLLDSLAISPYVSARFVLDVGSGAGLPGIPLAMMWPQSRITLLDSNQKKAAFMRQAIIELGLANATVVCDRIETWRSEAGFDLIVSRAFSDLPKFIEAAGRLCAADGVMAAMKGAYPDDELARMPPGFAVERVVSLSIPGLNEARHLVLLKPVVH